MSMNFTEKSIPQCAPSGLKRVGKVLTLALAASAAAIAPFTQAEHNSAPLKCDVNGDSRLSPLDALLIINHLNGGSASFEGMDVDHDGSVTPGDALAVINALNLQSLVHDHCQQTIEAQNRWATHVR